MVTANTDQGGPTRPTGPPVRVIYLEKKLVNHIQLRLFVVWGGLGFVTPDLFSFPYFILVPLIQPQVSALKQMIPWLFECQLADF